MMLTIVLASVLITSWEGYRAARESLQDAAFEHLTSVRETRARQTAYAFRSTSNRPQAVTT